MNTQILPALIAFGFVSSITPGPNNLMLLASGVNFGFQRTIPHMLGIGIGFTVMVMLVGVGLMQVFDALPASYQVLKVVSIAYLSFLAWKIATAAPPKEDDGRRHTPFTFLQAAAFQWVNPKAWTMALTAVSVYSPTRSAEAVLGVALVLGAVNLPSISVWTLIGQQLRAFLADPLRLRVFNGGMAILLLGSLYPVLFT